MASVDGESPNERQNKYGVEYLSSFLIMRLALNFLEKKSCDNGESRVFSAALGKNHQ